MLGGFGFDVNTDQRRSALREAIFAASQRLMAGSTSEGFGAFAPAFGAGMGAYPGAVERQDAIRRQAEEDERKRKSDEINELYKRGQMESMEAQQEERRARAAAVTETATTKKGERANRVAALKRVTDQNERDRLTLQVDSPGFWGAYNKTQAPAAAKPTPMRRGADGWDYEWDAEAGDYVRAIAPKPGKAGKAPKYIPPPVKATEILAKAEDQARRELTEQYGGKEPPPAKVAARAKELYPVLKDEAKELRGYHKAAGTPIPDFSNVSGAPPPPPDPGRKVGPAAEPAQAPTSSADRTAVPPDVERAIADELLTIPASQRAAAAAELRSAFLAGKWDGKR